MARSSEDTAKASGDILAGAGAEAALYGDDNGDGEKSGLSRLLTAPFRGLARIGESVLGAPAAAREFVFSTYGLGGDQTAEERIAGLIRLLLVIALGAVFLWLAYRGTRALFMFGTGFATETSRQAFKAGEKLIPGSL